MVVPWQNFRIGTPGDRRSCRADLRLRGRKRRLLLKVAGQERFNIPAPREGGLRLVDRDDSRIKEIGQPVLPTCYEMADQELFDLIERGNLAG